VKINAGHVSLAVCALVLAGGCVAQRGIDFGRWTGIGESTALIRVVSSSNARPPADGETVLILPPLGPMPVGSAETLHRELYKEARNYFPVSVTSLPADAPQARYVTADNLLLNGTQINAREAARAGAALGASHVLCVHVRDYRPYPPQVITMRLSLIDVATARAVVEIDASFDAAQQQVVLALADHLQRRRAREYGTHSLNVMLQSPVEYSAFVSASCCRSLAHALWSTQS
jgi:hypothetical protein